VGKDSVLVEYSHLESQSAKALSNEKAISRNVQGGVPTLVVCWRCRMNSLSYCGLNYFSLGG